MVLVVAFSLENPSSFDVFALWMVADTHPPPTLALVMVGFSSFLPPPEWGGHD